MDYPISLRGAPLGQGQIGAGMLKGREAKEPEIQGEFTSAPLVLDSSVQKAVYAVAEAVVQAGDAAELAMAIQAARLVRTPRDFIDLPLLAARAVDGDPDQAVLVAAAHHLCCLAAITLDDVQDGEAEHSTWAALGIPRAINVGVALIFASQRALARLAECGASPKQVAAQQADFARTGYRMCAGQHLDLSWSEGFREKSLPHLRSSAPLHEYWQLAAAKSGACYALGARAGARLGLGDGAALAAYTDYGHHLGLMVQAINDLRGLLRADHTDLAQGRLTLPVAYGLTVAPPGKRAALLDDLAQGQTDPAAAGRAAERLVELGALHYTLLMVEQHRRHAADALAHADGAPVALMALQRLLEAVVPDLSSVTGFGDIVLT